MIGLLQVIAGAGTLGTEILEQVPDVEAIVVPVGGAGLIAGTALAIKTLAPHVQVIGAEPASVPSLSAALEAGRPVDVTAGGTLGECMHALRLRRMRVNMHAVTSQSLESHCIFCPELLVQRMVCWCPE